MCWGMFFRMDAKREDVLERVWDANDTACIHATGGHSTHGGGGLLPASILPLLVCGGLVSHKTSSECLCPHRSILPPLKLNAIIHVMAPQAAKGLVNAVSILLIGEYLHFATFALVVYDWLMNLDNEIHCFWKFRQGRKLTAAALLYWFNRYPAIVIAFLPLQTMFPISETVCQVNAHFQDAINVVGVLSPAVFSGLRVYVLLPNSKTVAICTFLLLFVPGFITSVINALDQMAILPGPFYCTAIQAPISVAWVNGISSIIGDLIVLFITWRKTYASYKFQRGILDGPSLARIMLYNGSVYFIVITIMNVIDLALSQAPSDIVASFAIFSTSPMTSILTCRFLLDLHQANRSTTTPSSPSAMPSLNFAQGHQSSPGGDSELPAFIASIGSQFGTGLNLTYLMGADEDAAQANEEDARDDDLPQTGDEDAMCMADVPADLWASP